MDKADRAGFAAFFLACLFFAFLAGCYLVIAKLPPYKFLDNAYRAGWALVEQKATIDDPFTQTDQWRPARTDKKGVTVNDSSRALNGYTLYTSGGENSAFLIDMQGRQVYSWHMDYSKLWDTNPVGRAAQPDSLMYFRKAIAYPNGDLLVIFEAAGDTPWGYGMVKLDKNSKVLWKYHGATHHDVQVADDGRIFALVQHYRDDPIEGFPNLRTPWLDDSVVVINGDTGEVEKTLSIFDGLWNSRYQPLLGASPSFAMEDPLHTNSIQYLGPELGKTFAPAQGNGNQVLLSARHPGTALLLDLETGKVTWALKGSWLGQHSMTALPNGHFSIFDNYGHFEEHNMSRILEVDPTSESIVWQYEGTAQHPFSNLLRGALYTLPNGDRLATETDGGRLIEVAPNGDIVWEFINPRRGGDHDQYIPVVSWGQRIQPDQLDPAFRRELTTQ